MKHEKVQRSNNGIDPLPCSLSGEGFKRFQYCSNAIRSKRLGCAHTTARIRMLQILDDLPTRVAPEKQIEQWKSIVQELEQSIIDVDRKKSDAELAHAIQSAEIQREATKKSEIQGKLANTAAHIAELIKTHNHYLDKLERLRNEVLDTLSHNKVLKTNKP
ncbi:hypothetical protein [Rubritalea marina]|uniref:hypothetical protein n=1 Tax=Rubritalea marina TaxID=361055 RepID=UPI0012EAD65E|nr:hypothetical protein [Rubritalea marina]